MARAGLTAERLTLTAADLADEVGLAGVTMTALAGRVGVQVASLYAHVRNAEDLRTRLALLSFTDLAERIGDAVAGRSGHDALQALAHTYREFARGHPGRSEAMRVRLDPETAAASDGVRIAGLMRAVLRDYDLPETEQNHAVRLIGSVLHGFVALELAGGFEHSTPAQTDSWDRAIDALDVALRHWPHP